MTPSSTPIRMLLAFVGVVIGFTVKPAFAATTTTFQRSVSPSTSYTTMYDSGVSPSATSTAIANPSVIYFNTQPTGSRLVSYFDLSSIPAGSTVTGATLQYDFYFAPNLQAPLGLYRVTTNWLGGAAWSHAGGDWADKNGTVQGSLPFATMPANFTSGWFSWDVTSLVQGWINGTWLNYGVLIKVDTATTAYGYTYASGQTLASGRPKLVVTYTPPASDTTPPTGTVTINSGAATTNTMAVTLTLSATDNSGTVSQMQFSNDGTTYSTPEIYATTKAWTLASGDGTKTVYAKFKDPSGNWSTTATDTIVLDTMAPTISLVSASSLTQTAATVTWTTNEPTTSQVNDGTTTSYGQTSPLDTALVTSHSVSLSGLTAGTLYHYRVRSKDAAGNEAISADATFMTATPLDSTPPTGTITINGGAVGTNTLNVTLTLSATDNSGTVAQMQFSNDGTTYSTPEVYATTKAWTLTTGDGTKTVYAKFKDAAGNWSSPVSDTIALDTTPPTIGFISPKDRDVLIAPSP